MVVISRRFTYRNRIKLSSEDLGLVRAGRKSCTIRLGTLGVAKQVVCLTDGHDHIKVRITGVDTSRTYEDLTDEDAVKEGLGSKEELDTDLRRYYGNIDPNQPITIIYFSTL